MTVTGQKNGTANKVMAGVVTVLIVGFFSFWIGMVTSNRGNIGDNANRLTKLETQYENIVEGQRETKKQIEVLQKTVGELQQEVVGLRRDFRQTKDR